MKLTNSEKTTIIKVVERMRYEKRLRSAKLYLMDVIDNTGYSQWCDGWIVGYTDRYNDDKLKYELLDWITKYH